MVASRMNVWGDVFFYVYDNGRDHCYVYDNDYVLRDVRDDFCDDGDDDVDFFDVRLLRVRLGLGSAATLIVGKGVDSFLITDISLSLVSLVQPLARMNDLKYFSASLMKSSFSVRKYVQLYSTSLCLSF